MFQAARSERPGRHRQLHPAVLLLLFMFRVFEINLQKGQGGSVTAYPLTAPEVMPATICRLKKIYRIRGGIVISRMSMNSRLY